MNHTRSMFGIVLCAVFACDAHAISVQFSDAKDFAFSEVERRTIQTIAEAAERDVRSIFPQLTKDLTIEVRSGVEVIDSTGESAAVAGPKRIVWIVDARRAEGVAAIAEAHLRFALLHEMHHLVRGASMQAQSAPTLIDRAIAEGLATAFARDFAGMPVSWWGEYPNNIDEWAREFLALPDSVLADQWTAVGQWMFRHPDGRRFIGYKVGTYWVDNAMKASGRSSAELVSASSEEILVRAKLSTRDAASTTPSTQDAIPPKAAKVTGPIEQVTLGPVFTDRYLCVEHALELEYAGDAMGIDCLLTGGVEINRNGFLKLYRTDGKTNADWYGWDAPVLAPFDGTVVYVRPEGIENVPGMLGPPPAAGTIRFRNNEGVIVTYGHVAKISVKVGDKVTAGQVVAKLGNNGQTRAPGIHIGAYREADAVPLQIRWDLRAMAKARAQAGIQ